MVHAEFHVPALPQEPVSQGHTAAPHRGLEGRLPQEDSVPPAPLKAACVPVS